MGAYLDVTCGGADSGANHQEACRGDRGEGESHGAMVRVAMRWRKLCLGVGGGWRVHVPGQCSLDLLPVLQHDSGFLVYVLGGGP